MAVAEIFLAAFLRSLLDMLVPKETLKLYFGHLKGVERKMEEWRQTLSAIGAVLYDAEERQLTSKAVELWLEDLKDLAYDLQDLLDMFSYEILRRKVKEQNRAGTSKVWGFFPKLKLNFNINSEIEEIADRLQKVSERKDKLSLKSIEATPTPAWQRTPGSYVLDGPVVGRDEDERKIVEMLSTNELCTTNFHVIAIVGMPGLGKTTLAGHVFNALKEETFNPKVWVSVSDNFNVESVTKAIMNLVDKSRDCGSDQFSEVQNNLRKALEGKKFLIVLDDVWSTCNSHLWAQLQSPFRMGALGSKIIVTTRDANVAKHVTATKIHNLETLSDDDCFKLFEQHAFVNNDRPSGFGLLKEKIVVKCGGLPLVAKTLGGLLRFKETNKWEEILQSKIWSIVDESEVLPALKLSYHYLPSNLKRCFAYCSVLPNDYEFGEKQIILLWMAEGLLQQPEGSKQMEDIGGDYFGELLSRSLFQKSSKNNSLYVMHDLVSDLARWAAGDICFRLEDKGNDRCFSKARHSSYIAGHYDGVKRFEAFYKVMRLRTFLPLTLSNNPHNYLTSRVTLDLLPNLQYLRGLSLNGYQINKLPDSIGKLKHLRYLDLSHTLIMSLPESISTLYNLQTLILENCSKLKALPANMRNLTNLRHLNNSDVPLLEGMPLQLSQLTNLQTLPNFVVGKGSESGVREIGPLLLLRGTLRLSNLENVIDPEDGRQAYLSSKAGLHALQLEWSETREKEAVVLDLLKPHKKLKELTIKGYCGLQLSTWIGDPLFSNIVLVRLENCNNCRFLPPLGQLPSLRELFIREMFGVESVGDEFYGEGSLSFPVLETLEFEDMQQWKDWFPCKGDQGIEVFPSLKILSIKRCSKLEGALPENLDSLARLEIDGCGQLVVPVANYKQLCKLDVQNCKGVVYRSEIDFELLEDIVLSNISELTLETEGYMGGLRNVKVLGIHSIEELSSSWEIEDRLMQHMISLGGLYIERNCQLLQFHHLTSLRSLRIFRCSSLVSFPEASLPPSIVSIKIEQCNSLMYFARCQIPPGLRSLKISECKNLKLLVGEEVEDSSSSFSASPYLGEESCLEYLEIEKCPSLMSFSFRCQLPQTLKNLRIADCEQLDSISNRFHDDTCLERIYIENCANLKSLPEGLCHLTNLEILVVAYCGSLVSFPRGGLPKRPSNLTRISFYKLKGLPKGMDKHNLTSLQTLTIAYCEGLASILEEGFPPNLVDLSIVSRKSCKPLSEWGLQLNRLASLQHLWIHGVDLVSFPPEGMLLPKSLIRLWIGGFPNLIRLSRNGLQSLTSLESLQINHCPKLASIPEESLPLSLTQLEIYFCPLLTEKYKAGGKARYWSKIAHIPYIRIQDSYPELERIAK